MQPPCRHVKMSSTLRPFLDIDHPSWCRNHLKHWGDLRIHFLQYVCSIFPLKSMRIVFNHIQKRMTKDLQDLNKTLTRPEQENQPLVFCLVSHRFFPTGFLVFFGHQKNSSRTRSQQTEMENLLNVGQVQSNAPNAPRWRWRTGRNSSKVGEMEKKKSEVSKCSTYSIWIVRNWKTWERHCRNILLSGLGYCEVFCFAVVNISPLFM
jgi:hypothetical protein